MFHYTIFGGSHARMAPRAFWAVTVFGGTELTRPTLAQRVLDLEERDSEGPKRFWDRFSNPRDNFILTLFGATVVTEPTLMEEYSALRSLLATGALTGAEIQQRLFRIMTQEREQELTTLTLFAGFHDSRPSRKKQLAALRDGEKAGLIRAEHRQRLDGVAEGMPAAGIEVLGELVVEMA